MFGVFFFRSFLSFRGFRILHQSGGGTNQKKNPLPTKTSRMVKGVHFNHGLRSKPYSMAKTIGKKQVRFFFATEEKAKDPSRRANGTGPPVHADPAGHCRHVRLRPRRRRASAFSYREKKGRHVDTGLLCPRLRGCRRRRGGEAGHFVGG